jgi:large subunit ribosomal protein L15
MKLSNLQRPDNKKSKRVCGKGHKGQKSRSGGGVSPGFEGGQMPLQRRLPKKGFTNTFKIHYNIVHIKDLSHFEAGTEITPELLREKGMIKRQGPVKLLADGDVAGAYNIKVQRVSSAARLKIEAAGGTVEEQ